MATTAGTSSSNTNVAATNETEAEKNPQNPGGFHHFLSSQTVSFHGDSVTTQLPFERQVGSQVDRISSYGPRNDHSVVETINQLAGRKRSNSESAFTGSSREGFPQMIPEKSHVMKMLRSTSGGEGLIASNYNVPLHGAPQMRPGSEAFMFQPTPGINPHSVKSERPYNTCVGRPSVSHHMPSSTFRDVGYGPSVFSQLAGDEGSRTVNKGSGMLNSIYASNVVSKRNPSVLLTSGGKPISHNAEPESFYPPSPCGPASSGRQLTIVYAGHVHVFDDVHPNKADAIMALAGSQRGAKDTSMAGDFLIQKYQNILSTGGNSVCGLGSSNQGVSITKDASTSVQAAKASLEPKPEV